MVVEHDVQPAALKSIYCQNKRCPNGRPIGRMAPGAGCAEFHCEKCNVRRIVFGAEIRRKEGT